MILLVAHAAVSEPAAGEHFLTSQSKDARYEFNLVEDFGWNICRDYLKSLGVVQPSTESIACETKFDPTMKQFGRPQWEELNIEAHWDIVYGIERVMAGRSKPVPAFEVWRDGYRANMMSGGIKPRLRRAIFSLPSKNLRRSKDQNDFSYEENKIVFFGYTRNADNVETCQREVVQGLYLSIPRDTGDNLFYLDPTSKTYQQIYPDVGADFFWLNESQVVMDRDILFLEKAIPRERADGYDIKFYRVFSINPNPGMELHYYAQRVCNITARPIPTANTETH